MPDSARTPRDPFRDGWLPHEWPIGNPPADSLLLLAPDETTERALRILLQRGQTAPESWGPFLTTPSAILGDPESRDALLSNASPSLLGCVKALLASELLSASNPLSAAAAAPSLRGAFDRNCHLWAQELLREGRLHSLFQPIVEADTLEVFAYEALVRGRASGGTETLSAGQIIYACEGLGSMAEFDAAARSAAIRGARDLPSRPSKLFLNFSPGHLFEPETCLNGTFDEAKASGIAPAELVFEMVNLDESLSDAFLRRHVEFVRERGSRVALDDLDSSFLACHWIAELRPDYVKLDRSLVACLESSGSARSTLETITEFARQSGIRAVAEGIETPEQARICSESGVELLQGFLLARPANPPLAINKSFRTSSLAA